MVSRKRKGLNFIDLFAGAGGLSCGMEMAGHTCLLGVEHDKQAAKTFSMNHSFAQTFCGDVHDLDKKTLLKLTNNKKIDIVVGGPPCQGFSTVGPGNPLDKRNSLFLQFLRIVKILSPKFVIIENVTGLVATKNEQTLKAILKRFTNLNYCIDFQVMSSHHYGVAEKRRRTIIIGSKINKKIIFPKKSHDTKTRPTLTVGDVLTNIKDNKNLVHNHLVNMAQIKTNLDKKRLLKIPEGKGIRYQKDEKEFLPKSLWLNVNWKELRENRFRQTKYQRLSRYLPSPTIMTHRHSYYHPTETRFLTAREAAKIQSFPNDFIFYGTLSAQWRQIGNAVPPLLGRAIGRAIISMTKKATKENASLKTNTKTKKKILDERKKAFVYD